MASPGGLSTEQLCAIANMPDASIGWPPSTEVCNIDSYIYAVSRIPHLSEQFRQSSVDWMNQTGKKGVVQLNLTGLNVNVLPCFDRQTGKVRGSIPPSFNMVDVSGLVRTEYDKQSEDLYNKFSPPEQYAIMGIVVQGDTTHHAIRITCGGRCGNNTAKPINENSGDHPTVDQYLN